jgi:uncharacterized membrane protein YgaE (UPF0421/DUF939 family)
MPADLPPDDEHRGVLAVLGSPRARNRTGWLFQAGKSGMACFLALLLDAWLSNPDHVTSTFVAVLCISPVVLLGIRRARDQVAGSLLGGVWGTALAALGLAPLVGVPLAVAGGVLSSHALGFSRGTAIAAFTALFVQIVPRGGPLATFGVRLLAVGIGVAAASAVNVVVSAFAYRSIFERRLRQAEATVAALLVAAAREGPAAAHAGFGLIDELETELELAHGELTVRRAAATRDWLLAVSTRRVAAAAVAPGRRPRLSAARRWPAG